jgi:hypothetical protein
MVARTRPAVAAVSARETWNRKPGTFNFVAVAWLRTLTVAADGVSGVDPEVEAERSVAGVGVLRENNGPVRFGDPPEETICDLPDPEGSAAVSGSDNAVVAAREAA